MFIIKYTKNTDYLIIYLLPYLEYYIKENGINNIQFMFYGTENICILIEMMFHQFIMTHIVKQHLELLRMDIKELDVFLSEHYNLKEKILPLKPLIPKKYPFLKSKKYLCIFPKYDMVHNSHIIDKNMLDKFLTLNNNLKNWEIYIVGHPLERLNTHQFKCIDNFSDTLDYLHHCTLFITSESIWHYLALLCNCRNILIYSTESKHFDSSENLINYNPYHNNIYLTNNLLNTKTIQFIKNCVF